MAPDTINTTLRLDASGATFKYAIPRFALYGCDKVRKNHWEENAKWESAVIARLKERRDVLIVQWRSELSSRLYVDQDVKPQAGDPPGSATATFAYRVKNLTRTDLPTSVHTRKVIVEFRSGPSYPARFTKETHYALQPLRQSSVRR